MVTIREALVGNDFVAVKVTEDSQCWLFGSNWSIAIKFFDNIGWLEVKATEETPMLDTQVIVVESWETKLVYMILVDENGQKIPKVVSFDVADAFYKEKFKDSPEVQKYGLSRVKEPSIFADNDFKDFLWIAYKP